MKGELNKYTQLRFLAINAPVQWFNPLIPASNINFSLSVTKFLQPLNLAIFTTSLFNLLEVPAPHL